MSEFYTSVIQYGNRILYRGYKNGRRVHEKLEYSPTLYVQSKDPTRYKTLYGQYVESMPMGSINEAKAFVKEYEDVEGFKIFGMTQFQYQFIADKFAGDIEYSLKDMSISIIDLETASEDGFPNPDVANEQILLISIHEVNTDREIVWGFREYKKDPSDSFEYRLCKDEASMLRVFIEYWQANTPDILSGWNTEGYDIPYLINRIERVLGEEWVKKLSPWGLVNSREINTMYGKKIAWDISGVVSLDYLDLYRKYTYSSRESYTLGAISQVELNDTKLELSGSFRDQYTNQWNDFVRYNSKDTRLVKRLEDKLKFIELACNIAYLAKCNIKDTFGPVKTWDVFIYNYLKAKDIVIPPQTKKHGGSFEGAWVKEPIPGMYGWTMSFDFASLYPSIIRQWNMSPETILGMVPNVNVKNFMTGEFDRPDGDFTVAANGAMFKKVLMGIVPEVITVIIDGRKIAKKEMLEKEKQLELIKDELRARGIE